MQEKRAYNEDAKNNKSALTSKEKEHLNESMRHNRELMKCLALL
jgi:hypothetical protein